MTQPNPTEQATPSTIPPPPGPAKTRAATAPELPPLIRARGMSVTYPNPSLSATLRGDKGYTALSDIHFEVRAGERLGLLGRNGSGKSTLLRTLAGVYPHGGDLLVRGTRAAIFNATSGFVPDATGHENIAIRGVMLGLSRREIRDLTPSIIEFSELGEWIERPMYTYSSGMKLRLAFSIVTAVSKDILLMDEWIGAGDAGFIEKAKWRMDRMLQNSHIIVLASHNTPLMQRVCERAIVIEGGRVQFDGDVKQAIAIYREFRDYGAEADINAPARPD